MHRVFVLALLVVILSGCTYPRDPNHTTEAVHQTGTMKVGVSEMAPWVRKVDGRPAGIEVDLVEAFAREQGVDVMWVWGSQDANLEALKHYQLHVVIAGLTKQTPWSRELALTRSYFTEAFIVGRPSGVEAVELERDMFEGEVFVGREVAVPPGSVLAAYVKDKDGAPVEVADRRQANSLVAGAVWEISGWGFDPVPLKLHEVQHVMAVPRGENRWLIELDRFLTRQQAAEIEAKLEAEVGP